MNSLIAGLIGFALGLVSMAFYHVYQISIIDHVNGLEAIEQTKNIRSMTIEHLKTLKLMKLQKEILLSLRDENWLLHMGIIDYGTWYMDREEDKYLEGGD